MCSFSDQFSEYLDECTSWRWNDETQEHDEFLNWKGHQILASLKHFAKLEERERGIREPS